MSGKEKAAQVLQHQDGDGDQIMMGDYFTPDKQYTPDRKPFQGVAAFLKRGNENAISTAQLVRLVGCGTARQLQRRIEAERAAGALILSSSRGGYYLPGEGAQGRAEILAYKKTLYARAINTFRAAKAARLALKVLDGQEVLS